jgi:hypothetical protein
VTSWPSAGITEHHIRQRYFTSQNTFNPWTLIPKSQQLMNQAKVVRSKNSSAVYVCYEMPDIDYLTKKANIEGFTFDPNNLPNTDTL